MSNEGPFDPKPDQEQIRKMEFETAKMLIEGLRHLILEQAKGKENSKLAEEQIDHFQTESVELVTQYYGEKKVSTDEIVVKLKQLYENMKSFAENELKIEVSEADILKYLDTDEATLKMIDDMLDSEDDNTIQ